MGETFTAAEQEAVALAWVEQSALGGLELRIHPADEMLACFTRSPRSDAHAFEYLRSGEEAFRVFGHAMAECGAELARAERVLDFACGHGRITRFLVHALGRDRVEASEIDPRALEFVGRTLGITVRPSATDPAQVRLGGPYDVIFVGSLFSHLPRPRFVAWLRALAASLRDGGLLVFTTHGEHVRGDYAVDASGFTFVRVSETDRLAKTEYGSSFVRPEVVVELVREAELVPLGFGEHELWNLQDVFVARRSGPAAEPRRLPAAPIVYGRIERAYLPRPGHAWIGGGTRSLARESPLREVRLIVDGSDAGAVNLAAAVAHEDGQRREPWATVEWYTEGDASMLQPGLHTVCAVATTAAGRREVFGARGLRVPRAGGSR